MNTKALSGEEVALTWKITTRKYSQITIVALLVPYKNPVTLFSIYICKVQSFNHYCVHYNLTHKHKGTQWGEGDSDVEDHYLNVHPSYFNGNSTRK